MPDLYGWMLLISGRATIWLHLHPMSFVKTWRNGLLGEYGPENHRVLLEKLGPIPLVAITDRGQANALGTEENARVANAMRLCAATSFAGVPAVAAPTSIAAGSAQGVHVIAGFYGEDVCLTAAAAIEARLGNSPLPC